MALLISTQWQSMYLITNMTVYRQQLHGRTSFSEESSGKLADIRWNCHAVWHWEFSLQFLSLHLLSRHSVAAVCADGGRQPAVTVTGREELSAEDCRDTLMLYNSVSHKSYLNSKNSFKTAAIQSLCIWTTVFFPRVFKTKPNNEKLSS